LGKLEREARLLRLLAVIAISAVCWSCREEAVPVPEKPALIDMTEMNAREDCLYREIARHPESRRTSQNDLLDISMTATALCSKAVKARFLKAAPTVKEGQELARDDEIKTEQRALAIGLELKEKSKR
jgi:hypothetical protein